MNDGYTIYIDSFAGDGTALLFRQRFGASLSAFLPGKLSKSYSVRVPFDGNGGAHNDVGACTQQS